MPFLPEMVTPSPAGRARAMELRRLLQERARPRRGASAPRATVPALSAASKLTSGELLGTFSARVAKALSADDLDMDLILQAGFTPLDIATGLNHEQRPVADYVPDRAIRGEKALAAFAELLPDALGERTPDGLFLPRDLQPDAWLRNARETRGRAFASLVLWAQRMQKLEAVVEAAAECADADDGGLDRLARSVRRWAAAFRRPGAPGGSGGGAAGNSAGGSRRRNR
jgi:hypothetical protein